MKNGTFAGRLFWDAEVKKTSGGDSVTEFKIAVDRAPKRGEKQSPLSVAASIWGARGEKLAQYLTKGTRVVISGDIDINSFESKTRGPVIEMTCRVSEVTLMGGGQSVAAANGGVSDEDIPF